MGRKNTVPYALYRCHGFVNPYLAKETGFTDDDLKLLWKALESVMWEIDRSAARGLMCTRGLYVFEHDSKLGNAPAHELFELISINPLGADAAPRKFDDYKACITVPAPSARKPNVSSPRSCATAASNYQLRTAVQQPQLRRNRLHGIDDELDVLGEIDAEIRGAADDVVAIDALGEALRLHLLFDAGGGQVRDAGGANQGRGGDQAGKLIAGVEGLVDPVHARTIGEVIGVRLDGVDHVRGIAVVAEDLGPTQRVVGRIGPALVVKVMEQADSAPFLFVLAELASVSQHRRFDG
jgi:hypothetical protein